MEGCAMEGCAVKGCAEKGVDTRVISMVDAKGAAWEVPANVWSNCMVLRCLLEDVGDIDDPVPLPPSVSGASVAWLINFYSTFKDVPPLPLDEKTHACQFSDAEAKDPSLAAEDPYFAFFDRTTTHKRDGKKVFLGQIIVDANHLDASFALYQATKHAARLCRMKDVAEVADIFT